MKAEIGRLVGFIVALIAVIPLMRLFGITGPGAAMLFGIVLGFVCSASGMLIGERLDR